MRRVGGRDYHYVTKHQWQFIIFQRNSPLLLVVVGLIHHHYTMITTNTFVFLALLLDASLSVSYCYWLLWLLLLAMLMTIHAHHSRVRANHDQALPSMINHSELQWSIVMNQPLCLLARINCYWRTMLGHLMSFVSTTQHFQTFWNSNLSTCTRPYWTILSHSCCYILPVEVQVVDKKARWASWIDGCVLDFWIYIFRLRVYGFRRF